jgi:isopenicillin-N N-acyltransferase-like protein
VHTDDRAGTALAPPRELVARGSAMEIGVQHGKSAADLIHAVYSTRLGRASKDSSEHEVLARSAAYLPFVERHVPELLEEVNGIAVGARMSLEQAVFLQVATELELAAGGCSSLGLLSRSDGPLLAQNWDQPASSKGKQIILHLVPAGGPEVLLFTHAGSVGYIGVNSHGVGIVINQLYAPQRPDGLTSYFIIRKLLSFASVREGLAWLESTPIASNANYVLGDAQGHIVDVELGGGSFRAMAAAPQAHTNHYVIPGTTTDELVADDRAADVLPDSVDRLERINGLLAALSSEADALVLLKDHQGYPLSICRHEGADGMQTLASIVIRLSSAELSVCYGQPCRGRYRTYNVERRGST